MTDKNEFDTVITAKPRFFDLHLKETFRYKDLCLLFVKRDFKAGYKQTILGPVWAIIQPLLTTVMFFFVFGKLARLDTSDITGNFVVPRFLFYFGSSICWSYFASTLQATSNTFLQNRAVMGKVYYPRFVSPLSTAVSHLISFFIQFALLAAAYIYYLSRGSGDMKITPYLLLLPLCIIQLMMLSLGLGIIISSVTTKYRDLAMLVSFGLQILHYLCPVAYGLSIVPEKYMRIYMLNPVTPILTTFRFSLFGGGYFNMFYFAVSLAVTLVIFFAGLFLFGRVERTFMDTI